MVKAGAGPGSSPVPEVLTRKQAAEYIKESENSLDRLRRRGLVKACGGTRRPKYRKSELDRYLKDNEF